MDKQTSDDFVRAVQVRERYRSRPGNAYECWVAWLLWNGQAVRIETGLGDYILILE